MLETEIKKLTEAVNNLTMTLMAQSKGEEFTPPVAEAPKPVAPAETAPVAEAPTTAPATTPAPGMTIDEVRAKLGTVIQANGPAGVEAALKALGVAMLSELPVEKYAELLAAVGA